MYLSEVRLINWRSYEDVTFPFPEPQPEKPLVLIGAMNGHGKTSMLLGLYFGIFGRFGTRHAEGFQVGGDDTRSLYYRRAVQAFRRRGADSDDPTEVHIIFRPTPRDPNDAVEFHIQRKWFFTSNGSMRESGGEEVHVFVNGVPQRVPQVDDAQDLIESHLFPAHVLPAFFFDGEQAQKRIEESGDRQMRQAVEVLFGTKVLEELGTKLSDYVGRCKKDLPQANGLEEQKIDLLRAERDSLERELEVICARSESLKIDQRQVNNAFEASQQRLTLLGVSSNKKVERLAERLAQAQRVKEDAEKELRGLATVLPLPLALMRFSDVILERIESEEVREKWEALRNGTESRVGVVMQKAFPANDELLRSLTADQLKNLRERFLRAIEAIYEPPPDGCAKDFVYGHLRGKAREQVRAQILDIVTLGSARVEQVSHATRTARNDYRDAERRFKKLQGLPAEVEQIRKEMEVARARLGEISHELGSLQNQETSKREELKQKKAEIGRLETDIERMAPAQRRIEVVNRVRDVLSDFVSALAPLAMTRLEESVTSHFRAMADVRFKPGTVRFRPNGTPLLIANGEEMEIATMSGYERRTFGIAFSLALAEVSGFRAPLVIDTPLGNADSQYRMSLLDHIVRADLDQIIILTHDEEVVGPYHKRILDRVAAHYLVRFQPTGHGTGESFVFPDEYFEEDTRGS